MRKKKWVKKTVKKIRKHKAVTLVFLLPFLVIFFLFGFLFYLQYHQADVATFTDNVVRPTIGNTATINLESAVFSFEDHTKKIQYSFVSPDASIFAPLGKINSTDETAADTSFHLDTISQLAHFTPLLHEGKWMPVDIGTKTTSIARTFVRPDPDRNYAITALVKMDMSVLSLGMVAGTKEPGGPGDPGPGMVPTDIQANNTLVAAFDGGFLRKDGTYGMIVNGHTYVPLQKNAATFVVYSGNQIRIVKYTGQNLGDTVVAIRQNGPMLIENSRIVTSSSAWDMQTWGLTTTNDMYTWRSGVGVTANGNLIYAAGPSLIPQTLAKALLAAGAVSAMQLDINPAWARFAFFQSLGNGEYSSIPLTTDMVNGGNQYLHGYQKDFFYVYKNG